MKKFYTLLICSIILLACGKTEQTNTEQFEEEDEYRIEIPTSLTPNSGFFTSIKFLRTYNVEAMEKGMDSYWAINPEENVCAYVFPLGQSEDEWYYCKKQKYFITQFKKGESINIYPSTYTEEYDFKIEEYNRFSFKHNTQGMYPIQYSISLEKCEITKELTDEFPISRLNNKAVTVYRCGKKTFSIIQAKSNGHTIINEFDNKYVLLDGKFVFLWSDVVEGQKYEVCSVFKEYDNQHLLIDNILWGANTIVDAEFDKQGNLTKDCTMEADLPESQICYLILKDVFVINGEYYERVK